MEVALLGSRFTPPPAGQRALAQLADAEPNAVLSLIGPSLPAATGGEIEWVVGWLASNTLRHFDSRMVSGSINRASGQMSGGFYDRVTGLRLRFQGVAFQKQGLAARVFVSGPGSGALRVLPGTDFPYPGSEAAGAVAEVAAPDTPEEPPGLVVQGFNSVAAGLYHGVLAEDGAAGGGLENLKVAASGSFTGQLWIAGVRHTLRGVFASDGSAEVEVERSALPPVVVTLQLHLAAGTADGYHITGTVTVADASYALDAQRLPSYPNASRAPQEGDYTVALPAPEGVDAAQEPGGDGHGLLKVSRLGVCSGALTLADGTKTTFAGHVSRNGEWSLHRGLYGNPARGFLAGKAVFREVAGVSDVDGVWRWVKQAGATPRSPLYPGRVEVDRQVVGSRYAAPAKGARAWAGLADDWFNVWVRLAGPNLSSASGVFLTTLDRTATWTVANQVLYFGPDKLTLKVNAKTGLVSGFYQDSPRAVAKQAFTGVLLSKQGLVTGSCFNANGSGRFWMQAR